MRTIRNLMGCAALACLMIPAASADTWDKKTNVSFSESVEFPGGTVLAPGSYVLKLLNSSSNRHIVQVYNTNQDHMYAMVMTIPAIRLEPTSRTVITFYETPQNEPRMIHKWFYPGDLTGQEFAYPKGRVRYAQTASLATTQVVAERTSRTTEETTVAQVEAPPAPIVLQAPEPIKRESEEIAQAPAEEPVLLAQAEPRPQAVQIPETTVRQEVREITPAETLPSTASNAPYLAFGSMVLLAGAFLVRTARRLYS